MFKIKKKAAAEPLKQNVEPGTNDDIERKEFETINGYIVLNRDGTFLYSEKPEELETNIYYFSSPVMIFTTLHFVSNYYSFGYKIVKVEAIIEKGEKPRNDDTIFTHTFKIIEELPFEEYPFSLRRIPFIETNEDYQKLLNRSPAIKTIKEYICFLMCSRIQEATGFSTEFSLMLANDIYNMKSYHQEIENIILEIEIIYTEKSISNEMKMLMIYNKIYKDNKNHCW